MHIAGHAPTSPHAGHFAVRLGHTTHHSCARSSGFTSWQPSSVAGTRPRALHRGQSSPANEATGSKSSANTGTSSGTYQHDDCAGNSPCTPNDGNDPTRTSRAFIQSPGELRQQCDGSVDDAGEDDQFEHVGHSVCWRSNPYLGITPVSRPASLRRSTSRIGCAWVHLKPEQGVLQTGNSPLQSAHRMKRSPSNDKRS